MWNITINTFREIVRNKFLYLILFFAMVFIIFSIFLGKLTIGDDHKIIVDFGLAMIEIFGLVGVLFVGSQLLFREIEGKTIFLILSKPIQRHEFILGKFIGFSGAIGLIILMQSILFVSLLLIQGISIDYLILWALLFTFIKLEILLSLVFFLSTCMSHIITILVSLMLYFLSHNFSLLLDAARISKNELLIYGAQGIQLFLPPLEALNIKDVIGTFSNFSTQFFVFNLFYSIVYLSIVLFFTVIIFSRKTFE